MRQKNKWILAHLSQKVLFNNSKLSSNKVEWKTENMDTNEINLL